LKVGAALAMVSYGLIAASRWYRQSAFVLGGLILLFLPLHSTT
jgi:hypothetical protein